MMSQTFTVPLKLQQQQKQTLEIEGNTYLSQFCICALIQSQLNSSSASETPNGVTFAQIVFKSFFISHSLSAGCSHGKTVLSLNSIDTKNR